jgi:hypothetical protein
VNQSGHRFEGTERTVPDVISVLILAIP